MSRLLVPTLLLALPAYADQPTGEITAREVLADAKRIKSEDITIIDARDLSVEDLMALAAAERDNPTRLQCCDWGGSCLPHKPGS